ncbi:Ty1/Copia family ribonuclease HI [bacterium]|nr:Ty1/Copia family ribonuclease HI [bacterium]
MSFLAQRITKWSTFCDRMLHRLICYIDTTADYSLWCRCGKDLPAALGLALFCDADFASCTQTARSTTGVHLAFVGPKPFFPLSAVSKRQTVISHSTPESELVAADYGLRMEGIPALCLWEYLLDIPVNLVLCEDNESAARIIQTGRNPTMRHLARTRKVDLGYLHERFMVEDLFHQDR